MSAARSRQAEAEPLSSQQIEDVRAQLDRILDDPLFRDTTRMKRFLRHVTEEALAGRGDRLKGYTIGLEVFDKSSDFDPQSDTIVRVQAGQLRRRLDLYYSSTGQTDPIRLTIPKGRYAPCFEFRSPGEADETFGSPLASHDAASQSKGPPSIAVVTFADLTPSDGKTYFAEGLTAEIVAALVQFRHVRVITLRSTDIAPTAAEISKTIGRAHNVEFVLTGSVRRSGDVFRTSVNLASAEQGHILYTKSFDRQYDPEALFELQESIASNVAAAVAAPFGLINRHNRRLNLGRRASMSAYEVVLRFYQMGLAPRQDRAMALLEDVEEITNSHPDFSTGFAILSMLHTFLVAQCMPPADTGLHLDRALEQAERAARIDPQNGLAFFAQFQALHHSGRIEDAEEKARVAISLNPNDYSMLAYMALVHANLGHLDAAQAYDQSARSLVADPPHWFDSTEMVLSVWNDDFERAAELAGEVTEETSVIFPIVLSASFGHLGRREDGRHVFDLLAKESGDASADALQILGSWQTDPRLIDKVVTGWKKLGVDRGE
ncbi:MAG: hypothetical protein WBF53_05630 [Litorimonas sp.]